MLRSQVLESPSGDDCAEYSFAWGRRVQGRVLVGSYFRVVGE